MLQIGIAAGQRGWKRQPGGIAVGLGMAPWRRKAGMPARGATVMVEPSRIFV